MIHAYDPLKELQDLASRVAAHVTPGDRPASVWMVVYGAAGGKLFDLAVPCPIPSDKRPEVTRAGWVVTDRAAEFDGQPVPVRGRNLDVLRVLVESDSATVDELRAAWAGYKAEESTIRWQVGELKKALKKSFGDFPGELIEPTGAGYRLLLR